MSCSVSQALELSMTIKRVVIYHKKMDYTGNKHKESILKKGKSLELRLMSNLEIHVKIYLRNYMQKNSFITMNKKEHF